MTEIAAYRSRQLKRVWTAACLLFAALTVIAAWRLAQGEWDIPLPRVLHFLSPWLSDAERGTAEALVVRSVRLPRLLATLGAGGLLSVAGAVLQGLLSNPLAEPYTLGIAAGAAFGGALGLLFGSGPFVVAPAAFLGALAALVIVGGIAWSSGPRGGFPSGGAQIVLAGVVANAVLSAGVTFLKAVADDKLGAVVLWLMGSFSGAGPGSAAAVWGGAVVVLFPALACARWLDALSLGQGRGALLGVDEGHVMAFLLLTTSLGVAAAVSSFGIIGFVGLVVPHLLRLCVGPAHRPLLLLAFLAGGTLLAGADGFAQRLGELPAGVLTALIGGPFFCWLLIRKGRRT
ncbi:MAG: iron ABC transporter permease [Synergistaceae bacterium]|nr:iron ABC transporter permease [Synergistaceae bacterium]